VRLGLRERNKLEKLQRIKEAARALFTEKGFDLATTRAIARRAGVALGTLFIYAEDKRDLVFLVFNDELNRITDCAFGAVDESQPFLEQLLTAFSHFYRAFGENPRLSRILLQELTFFFEGKQAERFQASRRRTVGCLEALVSRAQAQGRIGTGEEPALIARLLFSLYGAEVRRWIAADAPHPETGIAELRRILRLQLAGLAPAGEDLR
jgi:AcrR family transcriptional regulator